MNDLFNVTLVKSREEVDRVNKKFYSKYNYPWQPSVFPLYPAGIATMLLNQDIGSWQHNHVSAKPRIWVAGCGTNQALFTALKFPDATVLGTDISTASLEVCNHNAKQLQVSNLQLEERSLNDTDYNEEFDYIICTGVVHHNADPAATLQRVTGALKKDGVLELMMYNYYHRLQTTACQRAIRSFYDSSAAFDMEFELNLLRGLVDGFNYDNEMQQFLASFKNMPEAALADCLLQPVEYSYTIASLEALASDCGLEYLQYCPNQFDVNSNSLNWNLKLNDENLQEQYNSLPDARRWQIANLLLYKNSPMLWFYFQRQDSPKQRKTEQEITDKFLETTFERLSFPIERYVLNAEGNYQKSDKAMRSDANEPKDEMLKEILHAADGERTMKEIFYMLDIDTGFIPANDVRLRLTTSAFPYLLAK
jgi:SAM-dependent methyltransferase